MHQPRSLNLPCLCWMWLLKASLCQLSLEHTWLSPLTWSWKSVRLWERKCFMKQQSLQDSETVKPSAKIIQNQGLGLLQFVYVVQAGQGTASEDHSSHRSAFQVHHPKLSSPSCQSFKVSSWTKSFVEVSWDKSIQISSQVTSILCLDWNHKLNPWANMQAARRGETTLPRLHSQILVMTVCRVERKWIESTHFTHLLDLLRKHIYVCAPFVDFPGCGTKNAKLDRRCWESKTSWGKSCLARRSQALVCNINMAKMLARPINLVAFLIP